MFGNKKLSRPPFHSALRPAAAGCQAAAGRVRLVRLRARRRALRSFRWRGRGPGRDSNVRRRPVVAVGDEGHRLAVLHGGPGRWGVVVVGKSDQLRPEPFAGLLGTGEHDAPLGDQGHAGADDDGLVLVAGVAAFRGTDPVEHRRGCRDMHRDARGPADLVAAGRARPDQRRVCEGEVAPLCVVEMDGRVDDIVARRPSKSSPSHSSNQRKRSAPFSGCSSGAHHLAALAAA